ncbi:esterase-like activity of phytase family protein [Aquabacter cavernae]|uniref:esterase-like activity of phytase family protein n=1 Tax=Aquabacter cavernae TaxID=2496029 RepID=UPI000F8DD7F0|nr:esterase-like activity of phytase family protein [Aquabacter cavernae]
MILSRRKTLTLAASGLLVAGLVFGGLRAFAKPGALPVEPMAIEVTASPIATFRPQSQDTRFGRLEFRGGMRLTSDFPGFGGISGFVLAPDGKGFLALTDAGLFLKGNLVTDGDRPVGLSDVMAAAMLDEKGRVQATRGRGDAEALAVAPDAVYVTFEDINELWSYPGPDPLGKTGVPVPVPPGVKTLRKNLGLEALVYVPGPPMTGALIAIGEQGATADDDLPGFIISGPTPGSFTVRKSGSFSATDAALGPKGDLYLLERSFTPTAGVAMQLRRFSLAQVKPGAVLDGEILLTADMGFEIDNMEGLSATVNAKGETLFTIVSDDNFSPLQRTILLRFALVEK